MRQTISKREFEDVFIYHFRFSFNIFVKKHLILFVLPSVFDHDGWAVGVVVLWGNFLSVNQHERRIIC